MKKKDDFIIPAYKASEKDINGLIEKGLLEFVGTDPLGRKLYSNTNLGNLIADELNKQESSMSDDYYDSEEDFDEDEMDLGFDEDDLDEDDEDFVYDDEDY